MRIVGRNISEYFFFKFIYGHYTHLTIDRRNKETISQSDRYPLCRVMKLKLTFENVSCPNLLC